MSALLLATLTGHPIGSNDLTGARESAREAIVLLARMPGRILVGCDGARLAGEGAALTADAAVALALEPWPA